MEFFLSFFFFLPNYQVWDSVSANNQSQMIRTQVKKNKKHDPLKLRLLCV